MGRHSYWWSVPVKHFVRVMPAVMEDDSPLSEQIRKAYQDAKDSTLKMPNGEIRMQLVERALINREFELMDSDLKLYVPGRTACRWLNDFVRLVGKNLGFKEEKKQKTL